MLIQLLVQWFSGAVAFVVSLPIVLALLAVGALVGSWVGHAPPSIAHELLLVLVDERATPGMRAGLVAAVVLVGPALEEGLYRGLLQSSIAETLGGRRWAAIWATGVFFAVMHLGAATVHTLPALLALAVALGWLYERTGSLLPSIVLHALFNAFNVAITLAAFGGERAAA